MAGTLEHLHELAQRDVPLHADNVGARHHHIDYAALAQSKDVLEHGAFGRRESGVAGTLEHILEVGTDGARLPTEDRPQCPREPIVGAFGRALTRLWYQRRQIAGRARLARTGWVCVRHGD